jgi:hypothetical protein
MPMPIPPGTYAGPKQETRANYYERVIMPFQMANYQRSMDEAIAEQQSEQMKLQVRLEYAKSMDDRITRLQGIQADLRKAKANAYTDADIKAANARAEEQMKRLGIAGTTVEGNLDRQTSISVANTRARGDAAAALRNSERDDLTREKQRLDTFITNEMGTGQADLQRDLLKQNIYAPIDQIIAGDEDGLPALSRGIATMRQHAMETGQRFTHEALATKLADIKDKPLRDAAVSEAWYEMNTPQEKEEFRRAYTTYNKYKNPDEYKDASTDVARSISGGGRAAVANPLEVANLPLPDAQLNETFGKENIEDYYADVLSQVDNELLATMNKQGQIYEDALAYERPSLIDRSREIFWEKYRNGKPQPRPQPVREVQYREAPYSNIEMGVNQNTLDVGEPPVIVNAEPPRRSRLEELIIAPRETSPAPLPAVPNPNDTSRFEWQGPIQQQDISRVMPVSPVSSYPSPGFRTEEQAGAIPSAFASWFNKIQQEREGLANRSADMRAQAARDISIQAAQENNYMNARSAGQKIPVVAPVVPQPKPTGRPESRILPPVPDDPNPIQAPPRVPVSTSQAEPAKMETAKNPGYQALELADVYVSQPKRFERLLSNDPVVKTAANTYAINKQNNVPTKETILTLNKTYANDPEKRIKAIAVVMALKKRDKLTDTLNGAPNNEGITENA